MTGEVKQTQPEQYRGKKDYTLYNSPLESKIPAINLEQQGKKLSISYLPITSSLRDEKGEGGIRWMD